jgi:hypothetical protein
MQPEKAMNTKVLLLRFCYWLGAILDGRAAINLTLLRFRELPAGILAQQSSHAFGLKALWAEGDAYALMWGWTALLLWADRKPVERRGVLLLTAAPVILLLIVQRVQMWLGGFIAFGEISFWFYILIGLGVLFAFACFYASPTGEHSTTVIDHSDYQTGRVDLGSGKRNAANSLGIRALGQWCKMLR